MTYLDIIHTLKQHPRTFAELLTLIAEFKGLTKLLRKLFSKEVWRHIATFFRKTRKVIANELTPPTKWTRTAVAVKIVLCASCYAMAILSTGLLIADVALIFYASGPLWKYFLAASVFVVAALCPWWMVVQAEHLRVKLRGEAW